MEIFHSLSKRDKNCNFAHLKKDFNLLCLVLYCCLVSCADQNLIMKIKLTTEGLVRLEAT